MGLGRLVTSRLHSRRAALRRTLHDNRRVQEQEIQVGDVVVSVTGGPEMTVQARSMNLAYCAWLSEGRLHQGTFEVGGLRRVRSAGPRSRAPSERSP